MARCDIYRNILVFAQVFELILYCGNCLLLCHVSTIFRPHIQSFVYCADSATVFSSALIIVVIYLFTYGRWQHHKVGQERDGDRWNLGSRV